MVSNVLLEEGLRQYSYDLPHRIHTTKIYPLTAPNGSLVIVYGHENGLRAVWRRPGHSEEEPDETGPAFSSAEHSLDVYLGGAEALHIDFPRLPANLHRETKSIPELLSERIIVSVACSDYSVRVVSLPIAPTEMEKSPEQVVILAAEPNHQSIPTCVSMTFSPHQLSDAPDLQMDDTHDITDHNISRPTSRTSNQASAQGNTNWDLVIASASPDLSGRLLIHRLPCDKSSLDGSARYCIPWKVHRLASSAVSVSFSSAVYPASHHLRLLIADVQGVVRIEGYMPWVGVSRRVRSLDTDLGFSNHPASSKPKRILDCCWLLENKAILVMMTTGEWGVWDVENTGPQENEARQQTLGSAGGSRFAISGSVQANSAKPSISHGDSKAAVSKYAPMTPSTRKIRQASLFALEPQQNKTPPHGGISVIPSPPVLSSRGDDSSVLLWHGATIVRIPSFLAYWQNQVRGPGNLFRKDPKGEVSIINNVQFRGEGCHDVSLDPTSSELEFVISAERRLIVIESSNAQKRTSSGTSKAKPRNDFADEHLLATGELDLLGMDRVLDSMSNGHSLKSSSNGRDVKSIKST